MTSADCDICKYVLVQGQSSSEQKVGLCLPVPSSPPFHFLHPFSPSCHEQEFASPDLHMISSCYLLPLPIHNFVTPPCTHSGNRQHPCCPGCCSPPSHTSYLLRTSPRSRSVCPTKSSRRSPRRQAQLCFILPPRCPGAASNCQAFSTFCGKWLVPAGFVTRRYTSRTAVFKPSRPRLAKTHVSRPVLQRSSLSSMRAIAYSISLSAWGESDGFGNTLF